MKKKDIFSKILAIGGTVLAAFPILAAVYTALARWWRIGRLNIDYLLPLELFPLILVGGGMLLWAALRAKSRIKWIAWSFGTAGVMLVLSQLFAVLTGLASGAREPTGPIMAIVIVMMAVYILAVIAMVIGGAFLIRDLFGTK